MWKQLTPDDILRVKRDLSYTRVATLSRYAAELKILDTQQEEIEKFERLVATFAEKYLKADKSDVPASRLDEQQSTKVLVIEERSTEAPVIEEFVSPPAAVTDKEAGEPAITKVPHEWPFRTLEIIQQVSPNHLGIPLRRVVGR